MFISTVLIVHSSTKSPPFLICLKLLKKVSNTSQNGCLQFFNLSFKSFIVSKFACLELVASFIYFSYKFLSSENNLFTSSEGVLSSELVFLGSCILSSLGVLRDGLGLLGFLCCLVSSPFFPVVVTSVAVPFFPVAGPFFLVAVP